MTCDLKQSGLVLPYKAKTCDPVNNAFVDYGNVFIDRHVFTASRVDSTSVDADIIFNSSTLKSPSPRRNNIQSSAGGTFGITNTFSNFRRFSIRATVQGHGGKTECERDAAINRLNYLFSRSHAVISPPPEVGEVESGEIVNHSPSPQVKPNLWTYWERRCDGKYRFIDFMPDDGDFLQYQTVNNAYSASADIRLLAPDPDAYGEQICESVGGTTQQAIVDQLPDPNDYLIEINYCEPCQPSAATGWVLTIKEFSPAIDLTDDNFLFTIGLYNVELGTWQVVKPYRGTIGGVGWKIFNGNPPYCLVIDTQIGVSTVKDANGDVITAIYSNQSTNNATLSQLKFQPGFTYRIVLETETPVDIGSNAVLPDEVSESTLCYYPRWDSF